MRHPKRAAALARCALLMALVGACTDQPLSPRPTPAGADAPSLAVGLTASDLAVTITGPTVLQSEGSYTWYANVSGGSAPYTYQWERRNSGSTTWSAVIGGTGSSWTRSFFSGSNTFDLRVTVTSAGGTAVDTHTVYVQIPPTMCGAYPCSRTRPWPAGVRPAGAVPPRPPPANGGGRFRHAPLP